MPRVYVDSDILIWQLRGKRKAASFLRQLAADTTAELCVGALQRAEIVFFMRSNEEEATLALLARFRTEPVTQASVDLGASIYRRWNPSHGTDINDAILAATISLTGGMLYTLNTKHYPMPEIAVKPAW